MSGLSKSTYEYYKSSKHLIAKSNRVNEDTRILELITPLFNHHKQRYGVRRIIKSLENELKGINHKKVERIMSINGLKARQGRNGKYHSYKGDNGLFKENLLLDKVLDKDKQKEVLQRNFSTTKPNEKWTTDVSEFKCDEGKLYLSPILDMYDSSIISYDISTSPNFEQTKRMIDKAFNKYDDLTGLIFHSDQGWQYQMKPYQQWLLDKGVKQSFSRKGNCMDNSLMENFFGIMKNEMYYGYEKTFTTYESLKEAMEEYIKYYNEERISLKRKGLSPLEYRLQSYNRITLN